MQYAIQYRVDARDLPAERSRLEQVYAELAVEQPSWLSCASFLLDEVGSMLLLIATDTVGRLAEVPGLSTYLHGIDDHCEGEPRAGTLDPEDLDTSSMIELGSWDPRTGRSSDPSVGVEHLRTSW
jgi:hypothetical protein